MTGCNKGLLARIVLATMGGTLRYWLWHRPGRRRRELSTGLASDRRSTSGCAMKGRASGEVTRPWTRCVLGGRKRRLASSNLSSGLGCGALRKVPAAGAPQAATLRASHRNPARQKLRHVEAEDQIPPTKLSIDVGEVVIREALRSSFKFDVHPRYSRQLTSAVHSAAAA